MEAPTYEELLKENDRLIEYMQEMLETIQLNNKTNSELLKQLEVQVTTNLVLIRRIQGLESVLHQYNLHVKN